jgi:peptidoglycan/xylan/chitin deacetylase (PgdA/CDA1 family)
VFAASAGAGESAASSTPTNDLLRADLSQAGHDLILTVRTASPVALAKLDRHPAGALGSRYLCLGLTRAGASSSRAAAGRTPRAGAVGERLLCLGGPRDAHRRVGLELRSAAGRVKREATLPARVKRPRPTKLVLALDPAAAGLVPARYRWRVVENRRGCAAPGCAETLPAGGATNAFRLRPVRPVGCTGGTAGEAFEGPSGRPVVALTFDDGPSEYTEGFLDALRAGHARGTFFEIGQEMPGREATMRRILREGDEIGDHTMNHVEYPGYAQIAGAAARIRAYTHFQPCLFRPPGGAVSSSVVATAGALGMWTILWNVDPVDWSTPGAAAVYSRVVSAARPGSIILMHDGGGDRSGTLAALPRIVDTLRARGYRFATVSQLLGHRMIFRPYG